MGEDKALWAAWYDVEEDRRTEYLDWLHCEHLPALKKQPGLLWVAHYADQGGGVPMSESGKPLLNFSGDEMETGSQYALAVGAAAPRDFLDPSMLDLERQWDEASGGKLSLRKRVRSGIFVESVRVHGPAWPKDGYGLDPAPAVMLGSFRMPTPEQEFELGTWYLKVRLPFMQETPGCIRVRIYAGVAGWAKYAAFYEFESHEDRKRWKALNEKTVRDPSHWTHRVIGSTQHAPGSPTIGVRTWPAANNSRPV
jgi:hypothetical protein